jgi:hypothetical protein
MNENQMNETEKEYEAPEVFELGQAEELTHGRNFGDWPDGLDKWIFAP